MLTEADGDAEALVLSQEAPAGAAPAQELALLTLEGALPAFSSEDAIRRWDSAGRNAIALPGKMVIELATQAEVTSILLNPGVRPHSSYGCIKVRCHWLEQGISGREKSRGRYDAPRLFFTIELRFSS